MVEVEFADFNPGPHGDPHDKTNMDLSELLAKHDQGDFLRRVAEGRSAADHWRRMSRPDRRWASTSAAANARRGVTGIESALSIPVLGTLNLRVPKLRQGSYFPGFSFESAQDLGTGRWWPSSRRRGSVVSRPVASMSWCRPWG